MACYYPQPAFRTESGDVVFVERGSLVGTLSLACGNCVGCRLERARQWSIRVMHEASLYEDNCFVTLTYDDEHLPRYRDLYYRDFQLFMKRIRKAIWPWRVRFFMCGEYGEDELRPHYHAALFGIGCGDRYFWRTSDAGAKSYRSPWMERFWKLGSVEVGDVNLQSAAYIARYVLQKVNGDLADDHYRSIDQGTGEVTWRVPEFTRMSLNPGIGAGWFRKFHADVYPHDRVVFRGVPSKPPRYYDVLQERREDGDVLQLCKEARADRARLIGDSSPARLKVKETVAKARLSFFRRSLK